MTAQTLVEQVVTSTTDWPEVRDDQESCGAQFDQRFDHVPDGTTWYCTRPLGHPATAHAAHYIDEDGTSFVGVAWPVT